MTPRTYLAPVIALVLVSCLASATSQPRVAPSDPSMVTPTPAASVSRPANAELGTTRAPLIVQTVGQPNDPEEKADEAKHRAWEIDSADKTYWLGAFMAVIAIFQLALFAVQLHMMRQNIVDTANAAKAAELNAKAAIGIELPFLKAIPSDLLGTDAPIPEEGPYGGYVNDGPPVTYNVLGPIEISNLGRTPAYSLAVSIGWLVARALPEQPLAFQRKIRMNHNMVLAAGAEIDFSTDVCIELSDEDVKDAAQDVKWLWVFGEIEYRDFMDQLQTARFCWRFANRNPPGDRGLYYLSSDGEPPAAYTRRKTIINV